MQEKTRACVEIVIDDVAIEEKFKAVVDAQKEFYKRIYCLRDAIQDGFAVRLVSESKKKD